MSQLIATLKREMRSGAEGAPSTCAGSRPRSGSTLKLIDVKDVLFFNSDEKYTRVVTETEEALIRKPLRELLDELDPNIFWQIHRGTIVNVNAIAGVTRDFRGDATVKVKNHKETPQGLAPVLASVQADVALRCGPDPLTVPVCGIKVSRAASIWWRSQRALIGACNQRGATQASM